MNPLTSIPLSFLVSLSVLSGWFVYDTQLDNVAVLAINKVASEHVVDGSSLFNGTTPNIDTNWFSSSSSLSGERPAAQSRDDEDDQFIAQGRVLGDSVGSDSDNA